VKDLVEIADEIKNRLDIHPVRWIEQVLEHSLERQPTAIADEGEKTEAAVPPAAATDDKSAVIKH
jgi:ATP-dependent Lon protease